MKITTLKWFNILALMVVMLSGADVTAQVRRYEKSIVSGGMVVDKMTADSISMAALDSLALDSLALDSLRRVATEGVDSLSRYATDSLGLAPHRVDSLGAMAHREMSGVASGAQPPQEEPKEKFKIFEDSTSLSKMCWTAAVLPGYGQIYNKQYWKLPILYGTLGASVGLFINENKKYQPLKEKYDELTYGTTDRSDELDYVQGQMIKSNTKRQLYIGAMAASYIYFLGDAAVNYTSNDSVSDVKKATTLAMICPGAGQIFNGSYWKLPFVVGGFATMIYCVDWNSRGYSRFKKAYSLRYDYDINPDNYPDGSADEFGGRYSSSYLKSIRNSYRRNRDYCLILTGAMYVLQIIDAHVDAHLKDYDISDDLTMNIEPMIKSDYSPTLNRDYTSFGFNVNLTF